METKTCIKCSETKPTKKFATNGKGKNGPVCRSCYNEFRRGNKIRKHGRTHSDAEKQYERDKYHTNSNFRIYQKTRGKIYRAIRLGIFSKKTEQQLGYTITELRNHLQSQFTPEMNWANYGSEWMVKFALQHADFDLSDSDEFKRYFSFNNIRITKQTRTCDTLLLLGFAENCA